MIWFSEDVLTTEMIFENYLSRLRSIPIDEGDEDSISLIPQPVSATSGTVDQFISPSLQVLIVLAV
jgi:dynein heavy chain 1